MRYFIVPVKCYLQRSPRSGALRLLAALATIPSRHNPACRRRQQRQPNNRIPDDKAE